MATIRDIAKAAGVSVGTASRAITGNGYVSEEARAQVLAVAEQLGYQPREHTRAPRRSQTIGIVLPDITFPFYGNFLKYADVELAQRGYRTVVCNTLGIQNRVGAMLDLLESGELAGLILNADVTDAEIARLEKLPVVSFERVLSPKIPVVASDHLLGGQLAASELLRCGCKNVLILTVKHNNSLLGDLRISECCRALEAEGVKVTVGETPGSLLAIRMLKELANEYMRLYSGIDGIFTDDVMAYCCVQAAAAHGIKVPSQLKIVGYDGNELIRISTPPITTIEQNIPLLTRTGIDLLMKKIDGEKTEQQVTVPVSFLKGGTT